MRKYVFLFMLMLPGWVFAQNKQIIEANSGEDLSGKVSSQLQYLFPEFTDGEVYFKKSPKGNGKLNYNMLVGEMQFLDEDGEVMTFDVGDVVTVNINDRIFFPYKGREFTEELLSTDIGQLRVLRKGNVAPYAKKGAYGTSSSTASIASYSNISADNNSRQFHLSVTSDVLISVRYFYYLIGANGKYTQITNVKSFTKQFPVYRTQIEAFVKEHNIRFDKADDLKALLLYCNEL